MTGEVLMFNRPDSFETMFDDVLRSVANPEMPEHLRESVAQRSWMQAAMPTVLEPAVQTNVVPLAMFADRMAFQRDAKSTSAAILLHIAAIGLIGWFAANKVARIYAPKPEMLSQLTVPPPIAPPKASMAGGGGGQAGPTPVTKGSLPKFADVQLVPPKAPPMEEPKIKIDPTIEVQKDLKMANNTMPNFGMPNSPLIGASMGNGKGTGIGSGNGSGLGAGSGGNYGGGPKRIGGGISAPVLIFSVEPEFSEEARKAKTAGNVLVNLWVDEKGNPTHVRVLRGVGMGLDEKAVAAVQQYKFKPALEGGKPVLVELNVEVTFQIF
jgi:periplasmic protein TonB